ncbi:hypothetical protein ABZX62_20270 [Streptomyces flavidovirens]|uniref:hypothetical protein n=1 Tax=Streptomyces flavidovirens TaxID=67298 RepID=UPI0033B2D4D3
MATYERSTGGHVAERLRPMPGSEEAEALAAAAEDPASGWRSSEPDPEPEPTELERPAKSASKATWVDYAVAQGSTREDAENASRDELAVAYSQKGEQS